MGAPTLEKLHVLVTGIDAAISRDVVRLLVSEGASVIAADPSGAKLARLERDVSLYRIKLDVAQLDLDDESEMRLWEENLRVFGRLPHLVICCCDAPAGRGRGLGRLLPRWTPNDVEISKARSESCPALVAERILQPSLFLHAHPRSRSAVRRAYSALRHPTLPGLLEKGPGRGPFSPSAIFPYVRIASQLYSLRRPAPDQAEPAKKLAATSRRRKSAGAA